MGDGIAPARRDDDARRTAREEISGSDVALRPESISLGIPVMLSYSVVIPVYRSRQCLTELAHRLETTLNALNQPYEVILVDDCSPDDSWDVIANLARTRPRFKGLQLMKNSGQTRATIAGIRMAGGEVVITMDDDLQHDPQLIPQLVEELKKDGGYDCVFAHFPQKKHAAYRNFGSRIITWINAQAFGVREIKLSSFRVMQGYIARIIGQNQSSSATPGGLILANAARIKYVALPHSERFSGTSNYTLGKQLKEAFNNICSVSMLPLRMISAAGLVAAALSGLLLFYFLIKYLTGGVTLAGWTTLVILITFFSGLILLSLGVIGEYLVRVLRELQSTSVAAVRQYIGFSSDEIPTKRRLAPCHHAEPHD